MLNVWAGAVAGGSSEVKVQIGLDAARRAHRREETEIAHRQRPGMAGKSARSPGKITFEVGAAARLAQGRRQRRQIFRLQLALGKNQRRLDMGAALHRRHGVEDGRRAQSDTRGRGGGETPAPDPIGQGECAACRGDGIEPQRRRLVGKLGRRHRHRAGQAAGAVEGSDAPRRR